jgi:hypothetical protein
MRSIVVASMLVAGIAACGGGDETFVDAAIDAAGGIDGATSCAGLELGACRRTAGCVADLCPGCLCDEIYRGCLDEGTQPAACPELGCPAAACCRADDQCQQGSCVGPGEEVCGGACNPQENECSGDRDCQLAQGGGALFICEPVRCACNGGAMACVEGCFEAEDCDVGETCDRTTFRCVPPP